MSSPARNWDLIAATFIVAFAAIGTAATSWIGSPSLSIDRMAVKPAIESVRPQLIQIRRDTSEAALQVRQELEQARQQVRGDLCETSRDAARMREDIRRLRSELREEIRSWFRH